MSTRLNVGDEVIVVRHWRGAHETWRIAKVGREYYTLDNPSGLRVPIKANHESDNGVRHLEYSVVVFLTKSAYADELWMRKHTYEIRERVRRAPIDQLKQIAKVLGYDDGSTP